MRPTATDLRAERARRSLLDFCEWAWPQVDPQPFVGGPHIDLVCERLERVAEGEVRRLLINVPPRYGKTLLCSVLFPAWVWASRPEVRFLTASYGGELSTRDARRMRQLVESAAYQEQWGGVVRLVGDQNEKHRFENLRGGARVSVGVGGAATGEGGDIVVIDDPLKIDEADSELARERVTNWFNQTLLTRLNDPKTGSIVVIGQRLHEADLFGTLIEQGDWEHLCLPASYDPYHPYLCADDPRGVVGEPLWPGRWSAEDNARWAASLGSYRAAGMLQQRPSPSGGGIFKREWWRYYDPAGQLPKFQRIVQSWDLTFTDSDSSDYVVGQVWGIHGADRYLLRQFRQQASFTQTVQAIRAETRWVAEHYPRVSHRAILVEQAANGAAVIETLKRDMTGVIGVRPDGDKTSRAHAITPQLEAGNIYLPGHASHDHTSYDPAKTPGWVQGLVEEAARFPKAKNDDQVDALTQALNHPQTRQGRTRISTRGKHTDLRPDPYCRLSVRHLLDNS